MCGRATSASESKKKSKERLKGHFPQLRSSNRSYKARRGISRISKVHSSFLVGPQIEYAAFSLRDNYTSCASKVHSFQYLPPPLHSVHCCARPVLHIPFAILLQIGSLAPSLVLRTDTEAFIVLYSHPLKASWFEKCLPKSASWEFRKRSSQRRSVSLRHQSLCGG